MKVKVLKEHYGEGQFPTYAVGTEIELFSNALILSIGILVK